MKGEDLTSGKVQVKLEDLLHARDLNILYYGKLSICIKVEKPVQYQ